MRILQFCSKPPLPPVDGGCVASFELTSNLINLGHSVNLVTISTEKHPFEITDENRDFYLKTHATNISVSTQKSLLFYVRFFLSTKPFQEHRFHSSSAIKEVNNYLLKNTFDLILIDGLMAGFFFNDLKECSAAPLIYRSHNIEHLLIKDRAKKSHNPLKKLLFNRESKKLNKIESSLWNNASQIWAISSTDKEYIEKHLHSKSLKYIPFSTEIKEVTHSELENTFFHLGAMDWGPNINGLTHFLTTTWKEFSKTNDAKIHLGGKGISAIAHRFDQKGVVVHKVIQNANDYYSKYETMIVPISAGSGIRIKTVQALAMGKVIISTEVGAKGIPAKNGFHMMICKDDDEMLDALLQVSGNNELKQRLKKEARQLYESEFSPRIVKQKIAEALMEI